MPRRRDTRHELPKCPKKPLTAQQERRLRILITAGATRDEAAAEVGITRRHLDTRMMDQLRDLRVGQGRQRAGRKRGPGGRLLEDWPELTPEELAARAAEVRESWTDEERERRRVNFSGHSVDG
jgi:hypothetical protein